MKRTLEETLNRLREIHGDKYGLEFVENVPYNSKIKLVCKKHGIFSMRLGDCFAGNGCKKCATEDLANKRRKTTEQFIEDARKVHGDKYDYSLVEYINNKTPVKLICPEHGEFVKLPGNLLQGGICRLCANKLRGNRIRLSQEEFINRAKTKYKDKFSYENIIYTGINDPVDILCNKCGNHFFRSPANFIYNVGTCPWCESNAIGFQKDKPSWFYILDIRGSTGDFTGYGITGNLDNRLEVHRRTLRKHGYYIEEYISFHQETGENIIAVESEIKHLIPASKLSRHIEGFITESCDISFQTFVDIVRQRFRPAGE